MKNSKYLILVNKENPMVGEENYEKVPCESIYANDRTLEKETYKYFLKLKKFIKRQGYIIDIESGYRSRDYQQKIWDECVKEHGIEYTKKYVANPGYSEHQTGLAVDFLLYENNTFYEEHKLKEHPVLKQVIDNAYKFGFILRYPKGKEKITGYNYEPWHLRYVGSQEIAKYIKEKNLCLEEYLDKII